MASRKVMALRVNDRVEDRSLFSGYGRVLFVSGNEVRVRFDDGSEEGVDEELFRPHKPGHWLI